MVRNPSKILMLLPFLQLKFILLGSLLSVPIFMATIMSVNVESKCAYIMKHNSSFNIFCRILCNLLSICFTNMRKKTSFSMHIFGDKLTNTCVCFYSELAKLLFICSLIMMMNKSLSFMHPHSL